MELIQLLKQLEQNVENEEIRDKARELRLAIEKLLNPSHASQGAMGDRVIISVQRGPKE